MNLYEECVEFARRGDEDIVQRIVPRLGTAEMKEGYPSMLEAAAQSGNLSLVKWLVNGHTGSEIKYNSYPLANAVWSDHVEVARFLLENGCEWGHWEMHPVPKSSAMIALLREKGIDFPTA